MKLLAAAAALVAVSIAQPASAVTIDLDWDVDIGTSNDASISVGDTVRWTWTDTSTHTVESSSGPTSFNSGFLTGMGTTFSYTFEEAGCWDYFCDFHGAGSMSGTIDVSGGCGTGGTGGLPALGGIGIGAVCGLLLAIGVAASRFRRGSS